MHDGRHGRRPTQPRAASPVVGVVLVVAVAVILAATVGAAIALAQPGEVAPQLAVRTTITAADGYPDGQVITVTHRAGDAVSVEAVALVVTLERVDRQARLSGFPTRRLTSDHVAGAAVFDGSFAGVDGEIDAAHTDGTWRSGERIAVRIAQSEYDVERGEPVSVWVVHEPTTTVLARQRVRATG